MVSETSPPFTYPARLPPQCEVFIYEGEGHAFMNPSTETVLKQREMFNLPTPKADSQELAWGRLFDFFGKHLRA